MKRLIAGTLCLVGLMACGGAEGAGGDAADMSQYEGEIQSTDVEAGKVAFEDTCGSCHSESENPIGGLAWSVAKVRKQIREGDDEMPAIPSSRLSDEDMEHVLALLATWGTIAN